MGCRQLLELFVYILFLLVFMPLLLLWAGRFAKYCSRRKPGWIGFPEKQTGEPAMETDGGVIPPTSVSPHEANS
jgi:hypothetical protein